MAIGLALALAIGGLAGCGSDDDDTGTGAAASTTSADNGSVATSAAPTTTQPFEEPDGAVRGFDGTTIRTAAMGLKSNLPAVGPGVQARFKRFNDSNEIPGLKIEFVEYADDKGDPATSLAEARRLVASEKVFAIVGNMSATNPGQYFEQEGVPYVGAAFDSTYCSTEPSTDGWGYSPYGCFVPEDPPAVSDVGRLLYEYVSKKSGKEHPTLALFSNDTESGKATARFAVPAQEGAGFDVVYAEASIPPPPVSDYTPYVQELLTSDAGKAPDAILCMLTVECIAIWQLLEANGYAGTYQHFLYSDLVLSLVKGTVVQTNYVPFGETTPALTQMRADVAAIDPSLPIEVGVSAGYLSADMFIQALKMVVDAGTEFISPENVQRALSTMTWEAEGLAGPITYPASTVTPTPTCNALVENLDGTAWKTVAPFSCSSTTFPVE